MAGSASEYAAAVQQDNPAPNSLHQTAQTSGEASVRHRRTGASGGPRQAVWYFLYDEKTIHLPQTKAVTFRNICMGQLTVILRHA